MIDSGSSRRFLATRYGAVHYWTLGRGPALLMLHQSAQSADEYLRVAPLLEDSFTVIALDLPGHGASDTPDHELGVDEYCDAAVAVLDELGVDKVHLAGHHGGCMLAAGIAVSHPDRVHRLVLSGGGLPDPEVAELLLNNPMTRDLPVDTDGDFLQKTWDVYRRMSAPGTSPKVTFLPFIVGLRARMRPYDMHFAVLRWDYGAAVESLEHETLLIKAEHDAFSGDVAGLHGRLPRSTFVTIPDCGPWLFYEQPQACANAIKEFLSS